MVLHHNICICLSAAYKYSTEVIIHNTCTVHNVDILEHQEDVAGISANISL